MHLLQTVPVEPAFPPPGSPYRRFRIPGVVPLPSGGALLYYECRAGDSDWAATDLCMRRVFPDGTVGPRVLLAAGEGGTANNPVMIAEGGTAHFLYCLNYRRVFCRRSADGGGTWTPPVELTAQIEASLNGFFFSCIAVGPGHGLRLASGRLIAPVWMAYDRSDPHAHRPSVLSALYSDDGGARWRMGAVADPPGLKNPSESCLAELPDGSLLMNARNENPDRRRRLLLSADGGVSWSAPRTAENLPDPVCCAGLCRDGDTLLFTNCANEKARRDLTLKRLTPEGEILEALTVSQVGGYSDLCLLPGGRALVFFERDRALRLSFVALTET